MPTSVWMSVQIQVTTSPNKKISKESYPYTDGIHLMLKDIYETVKLTKDKKSESLGKLSIA